MALKCGCYMLICRDQLLVCAWQQSGARSKNDHAYSIGFVKLRMAVTRVGTYNNISSQLTETKMTVHIGDFQICTRQLGTTDDNISSYLTEAELTGTCMYTACALIPCILDFFYFSYSLATSCQTKIQYRFHSVCSFLTGIFRTVTNIQAL